MANLLQTMGSNVKSTENESVQCQKDSNVVDLTTLAYLLNLDRFSNATDQHEALLLHTRSAALAVVARHLDSLPGTYDSLHRLFKNDQKSDFARIYNYSLDLWDCVVERTLINPYPRTGFLEFLTGGSQQIVVEFLTLIRNNPDYILAAIRRRSDIELESLVFGHRYPLHNEDHPHYRTNITNSPIAHLLLTTLHAQLPTFSAERTLHRTLWTRIFVTLLSEQRAEKFIIEALDHYIHHLWDLDLLEPTKRRLELSLLNILRRGECILGQLMSEEPDDYFGASSHTTHTSSSPPANPVVRASIHMSASISSPPAISKRVSHPAAPSPPNLGRSVLSPIPSPSTPASSTSHSGSSHRVESFFDNACVEILSVLDDPATQMIPPCLVELVQGILKELPEDLQNYAKGVLTVKFFFSKFVGRWVMHPEYYGLLEDCYISEAQRQRILIATHNRLCKHVMESTKVVPSWGRRTAFMDPRIRELVGKVVARFNPDSPTQAPAASSTAFPNASPSPYPSSSLHSNVTPTLLVCPSDISSLFHFLCPEAKPATELVPATSPGRRGRSLANRANANATTTTTATAINATTIAASAPTTKTPLDLSSSVSSTSSTLSRFSTASTMSLGTMNASSYSSEGTHNIEKQYAQQTKEDRNLSPSISSTVPTDEAELVAHLGDHPIYAKMQKVVEELRRHVSTSVITIESGTTVWRSSVHPMSEPWALLYVSRDGTKVALTEAEAQVERRADGEIAPRRQRRVVFTGLNVGAESKECNTAQTDAAADDDAGWNAEASADDEGDLSEEERIVGKALFSILREMELASSAAGIPMMNGLGTNGTFIGSNTSIPVSPMLNRLSMHGRLPVTDQVVTLPLREAVSIAELFQQAIQVSQAKNDHAAALSYHHAATVFSHLQRRHMRTQDMPNEGLVATEAEYDAVLLGRFAGPLQRRTLGRQVRSQRRQSSQVYLHDWHTHMSGALQAKKKVFEALRLRMFYAAARNTVGTSSGTASPTMGQRGWDRLAGVVAQCFGETDAHVLWANNTKRAVSGGKEQRPPIRRNSEIIGAVIIPSPSSSMTTMSTTQVAAEENGLYSRTRRTSIGTLAGIVGVKKTATEEKASISSKVKATATFSKSNNTAVGILECAICHKLQCTCQKRPSKTPVAQAQQANKRFSLQQPSVEVEKKPLPLDQSQKEQVARWLRERGVHNFLPSEERFHYFCMEVEIFRGVMFKDVWSDVLFMREAKAFGLLPPEENASGSSSAIITVPEAETLGRRSLEMALPGFGNQFQQGSKKNSNHRRESSASSNSSLFGSSPLFSSTFGSTAAHVHHSHHHHLHRQDHHRQDYSAAATQQNLPGYSGHGSSPATSLGYFSNVMSLSPLSSPMSPPMSPFAFQTVSANMSSSSTSISSTPTSLTNTQSQMDEFSMMLELQLTGLICSEFGAGVMSEAGCETDRWFEEFLAQMENAQDEELEFDVSPDVWGDDLFGVETARPTLPRRKKSVASAPSLSAKSSLSSLSRTLVQSKANAYPLLKSYKELMRLFALHPSPYQKLHTLFALELLIVASLTYDMIPALPRSGTSTPSTPMVPIPGNPHSRSTSHTSSTATSTHSSSSASLSSLSSASTETNSPGTDAIVNEIERLFRSSFIRPRNLIRDLQMISSFVPATILDLRDEGKAFWDMSLAVMSLKKQVVERIVERGMRCIEGDSKERKGGSTPHSTPAPSRPSSKDTSADKVDDEHAAKLQMEAVRLFAIAAKESHPGAQRELAILHLSDPSLPDTTLPPASLPTPAATLPLPTLKGEESSDPTKFNAKSVAAALHWFALAAAQGDEFSRTFLEHREGGAMGGVVGVF